jgi:hypothetical protein
MKNASDLPVGKLIALANMLGGHDSVIEILSGRVKVKITETPRWFQSEEGVTSLKDIPYEDRSAQQWVERFEKGGIRVDNDVLEAIFAKMVLVDSPIPGARNHALKFKVVILQGKEGETIGDVWNRGISSGLMPMTAAAACHLRGFVSKNDLKEMGFEGIMCMEAAKDRATTGIRGYQLLLWINRDPVNPHFMLTDGNDNNCAMTNRGYAFLD